MATRSEGGRAPPSHVAGWIARCFLATIALCSIAWGMNCLPIFLDQTRLGAVTDLILRNVPLSDAELDALGPLLERAAERQECAPAIDRSSAIIRLRLAENALAPGRDGLLDTRLSELDRAVRKSLGCAPSDPYLWLVLFWLRNTREGYSQSNLDLLRMSYRLGPNEAWIVTKRNHIALAMLDALPPDLSAEAIAEFSRLVKSELYTEAMALLKGPGWSHRDRLMAGLSTVPQRNVDILIKAMADIGFDLDGRTLLERRSQGRP